MDLKEKISPIINKIFFICFAIAWLLFDFLEDVFFPWHNLKYIVIILHIVVIFILNAKKIKISKFLDNHFSKEVISIVISSLMLYVISLFFQLLNGQFKMYSLIEVVYLLLPAIYVFTLANSTLKFDFYFFVFFVCALIGFIFNFKDEFSFINFNEINFDNSYSPFESDLAGLFLLLFTFYFYRKKYVLAIISWIICFLSFKRIHVIYLILLPVLSLVLKKQKVSKKIYIATSIFFILSPYLIKFMVSENFERFFVDFFDISLVKFSMGRNNLINSVLKSNYLNYGLGTISNELFLGTDAANMHCDLLRVYLETTIIGVVIIVGSFLSLTRRNLKAFILIVFYLFVMMFSHMLTNFLSLLFIMMNISVINKENGYENNN